VLNCDRIFFKFVLFSDEATFYNTGQLNQHNSYYWSVENSHWYKLIINITGASLYGVAYYNFFLQQRLLVLLEDIDTRQRMFFQQDDAHWNKRVRYLDLTFLGKRIEYGGPVSWCPRSPDLSSLDFFLWGYLNNVVYSKTPTTRENMMERIILVCHSISRNVLLSTVDSFERRVQLCVDNNGQIFEHLLRLRSKTLRGKFYSIHYSIRYVYYTLQVKFSLEMMFWNVA